MRLAEGETMTDVVVLGAGVAGHTAALHLRRMLGKQHHITVVSPNSLWNWIPSNIWVGVGEMGKESVVFPLEPIYQRKGIDFRQAKATAIRPNGDRFDSRGAVDIEYTGQGKPGSTERIRYDYLINATGPRLKFEATEGMGPDGYTLSVCTADHAVHAAEKLHEIIEVLKTGTKQTLVIGMGHGTCTCQGAAFEYVFNVDHELREAGVRDLARLVYLTNEAALGDFGVDGMTFDQNGFQTTSELWTGSLFRERGVEAIIGAHVERIEQGLIHYETLDGKHHTHRLRLRDAHPAVRRRPAEGLRRRRQRHHRGAVRPQRLHEGGRRLHPQAVRAVARRRTGRRPTWPRATTTSSPSVSRSLPRTRFRVRARRPTGP